MFRTFMLALTAFTLTTSGVHLWTECAGTRESPASPTERTNNAVRSAESEEQLADEKEVAQRIKNRGAFAAFTNKTIAQMVRGELSLQAARDQLLYYCMAHYPEYLHHIQIIERGHTLRQQVAICLVRFVRNFQDLEIEGELAPGVLASLETELNQIMHEDDPTAVHATH
jgi:hypothetical protein